MDEMTTPVISITAGHPDDEELAAVLAVLQAATAPVAPPARGDDRPLAGGWNSYHRTLRRMPAPGREAWRHSVRP